MYYLKKDGSGKEGNDLKEKLFSAEEYGYW